MNVVNHHFDPFFSLVNADTDGTFKIVTRETDRELGDYWITSVRGLATRDLAETYLNDLRKQVEIEERL